MSEHKRNKNNRSGNQLLKTGMVWTILLAALVAVFVLSIAIGSSGYPLSEVLRGLWDTEAGKIRINKVFIRMFFRFWIMRYGIGYAIPHFLSRE